MTFGKSLILPANCSSLPSIRAKLGANHHGHGHITNDSKFMEPVVMWVLA